MGEVGTLEIDAVTFLESNVGEVLQNDLPIIFPSKVTWVA